MADQQEHLIGQPEISELLMRALFLKGDLPQFVGSPYAAVLQMADLAAPEYMPLRRWRRFCMRQSIGPNAGNFTGCFFGLRDNNPNGREVMAVVEALHVRVPNAATVVVYAIDGDMLALGGVPTAGGQPQDDRSSATTSAAASSAFSLGTFTNAASPLSGVAPQIVPGNTNTFITSVDPDRPLILTNKPINNTPRSVLWIVPTVINAGVEAMIFWRERGLLETEL